MSEEKPEFIIIGAMKSATSTLHEQLALQPGIFMSTPKEPNFFSNDQEYAKGLGYYAGLFAGAAAGALKGESSTHYTKLPTYPKTIERMKAYLPTLKLIYVIRNPIDRLVSHYMHEWSQRVYSETIDEAVKIRPEMVAYGCYARQLEPYFDAYGRENVLPIFFDKLTANPQEELERACQFIGYSRQPKWDRSLGAQNVSKERLRKSPWRDALVQQPVLKAMRRTFIPRGVRNSVKRLWKMEERPHLSGAVVEELKQKFDADLRILSGWLGFDISCDTWHEIALRHTPSFAKGAAV